MIRAAVIWLLELLQEALSLAAAWATVLIVMDRFGYKVHVSRRARSPKVRP